MDGATGILIRAGVRLVIFGAVFYVAARKNPKVAIHAKWATPLVAVVFAALNTGLYWALKPILDLATLGALSFFIPLIVNTILLVVTVRFFAWDKLPRVVAKPAGDDKDKKKTDKPADAKPLFEIHGLFTTLWMALILTAAHGVLWLALDYFPNQ
jgi:hypothetical protein